jgi:RNA polymerase sigma factor (sigma-70 family)
MVSARCNFPFDSGRRHMSFLDGGEERKWKHAYGNHDAGVNNDASLDAWRSLVESRAVPTTGDATQLSQLLIEIHKSNVAKQALNYARHAGLSRSDAEDIYQEAMLSLIKKCCSMVNGRDVKNPARWLLGAMRLIALRLSAKRHQDHEALRKYGLEARRSIAQQLDIHKLELERVFYALPQRLAQVLAYKIYDDESFTAIAAQLVMQESRIRRLWQECRHIVAGCMFSTSGETHSQGDKKPRRERKCGYRKDPSEPRQRSRIHRFLSNSRPFARPRDYTEALTSRTAQTYKALIARLLVQSMISDGQAAMLLWFIENWYRLRSEARGAYRQLMKTLGS